MEPPEKKTAAGVCSVKWPGRREPGGGQSRRGADIKQKANNNMGLQRYGEKVH